MKLNKSQKKFTSDMFYHYGIIIVFFLILAEPLFKKQLTTWSYFGWGVVAFILLFISVWILGDSKSNKKSQ